MTHDEKDLNLVASANEYDSFKETFQVVTPFLVIEPKLVAKEQQIDKTSSIVAIPLGSLSD